MKPVDHHFSKLAGLQNLQRMHPLLSLANQILDEVIDNPLRCHCQVVNLTDEQMIIAADNGTWLTRLRYQQDTLLDAFNQHQSFNQIREIRLRVLPASQVKLPPKPRPPKVKRTIPPSAAEHINQTAAHVKHPDLKAALTKLARHLK